MLGEPPTSLGEGGAVDGVMGLLALPLVDGPPSAVFSGGFLALFAFLFRLREGRAGVAGQLRKVR